MSSFERLLDLSSRLAEAGLVGADAAMRGLQKAARRATGTPLEHRDEAPLGGPSGVDAATSELANRWLRLARDTPARPGELGRAGRDAWRHLRRSFAYLDCGDPRQVLDLAFELPLSLGTLVTQESLRTLATLRAVPSELIPDFLDYVLETFSDLHVYFSLQYQEEIARLERRLERDPHDGEARLELGRTYLKCGLLLEARRELRSVAADFPELRRRALYETTVASYRAGRFREAVEAGAAALDLEPADARARWWTFLAADQLGGYPDEVPEALRMEVRDGWADPGVEFDAVAREIGLDKTSGGRGTAVFDFDGDGHLDVAIAGAHAGVSLYRNRGDGTFEDVSVGSGLDRCVYGFALAAADFDGDGREDLYVSSMGFFDNRGSLYHNQGDGTFRDVTEDAGLGVWGPGFCASWVDFDGDGHLDLFLAHNLGGFFDRKTPNRLFKNKGDGTFEDVADEVGLRTFWPTLGVAWGDFRNCGLQDLFLSNLGRSQLFRNQGDGTFKDVSREAGVHEPAVGSAALAVDVDQDGWLDVVQFTYSRPQDAIHTLRHGEGPENGSPTRIWRNNRDGTFTEIGREIGLDGCWGTMSGAVGDYDNDGHLDLFLGNGDPGMDRNEASILYRNDGRGHFKNVTFAAGLPFTGKGHGMNMADLAGDGRLHLIVGSGGLYPGDLLTTEVYRPRRRPGHYLNVRLEATASHRNALGARLRLRARGRDQHRVVSGGSGFGWSPLEQHFGLGLAEAIDHLEIRWPSGAVELVEGPPIDRTLRFVEGRHGFDLIHG